MPRPKFSIVNLLLVTALIAIGLAWWVTSLPKESNERFVVHFCFTQPSEQIVSITTLLDEPFEVTCLPLESDRVENALVGKLTRKDGQLDLEVQGNLDFSGVGYRNPYVELQKPFSIMGRDGNAVIVTRQMDCSLEHQLKKIVSVPSERTELVRKIAREYLDSQKVFSN